MPSGRTQVTEHHVILRCPQVLERTGLRRTGLYEAIRKGDFPASIPIGSRSVGWLESEVDAWIAHRVTLHRHRRG
ncbi:MAG: AlpA family transcriptional regulator [Actinomycetales bacterium]|nr:AlpA family transcriptional regulator [Actinomycetales bacterium]